MSEVVVRYRPGEALRWLESGGEAMRRDARSRAEGAMRGDSSLRQGVRDALSALRSVGNAALADLTHRRAQATQYVFADGQLEVIGPASSQILPYDGFTDLEVIGERAMFRHRSGRLTIKPFAHVVAGRVKVPIGWTRNGVEVPYELLIEELAARSGLK